MGRRFASERGWSPQKTGEKVSDITVHFVRYLHGSKGHLAAVTEGVLPESFWDHQEFRNDAWRQARFAVRHTPDRHAHVERIDDDTDDDGYREDPIDTEVPDPVASLIAGEAAEEAATAIAWAVSDASTLSPGDREIIAFEARFRSEMRTEVGLNEALARHLYPTECGTGHIPVKVQNRARTRIDTARERLQGALIGRASGRITAWLDRDARVRQPVFSMFEQVALRYLVALAARTSRATLHRDTRAHLVSVVAGQGATAETTAQADARIAHVATPTFSRWIDQLILRLWRQTATEGGFDFLVQ
jgi:hypothetical protein